MESENRKNKKVTKTMSNQQLHPSSTQESGLMYKSCHIYTVNNIVYST